MRVVAFNGSPRKDGNTFVLISRLLEELSRQGFQTEIGPHQVGLSLFGPYLLGVELAALILLSGLVGAYHLGRRSPMIQHVDTEKET